MSRPRKSVILLGAVVACAAGIAVGRHVARHVARHGRGAATGQGERGGILIGDTAAYDAMSRLFFGSLFGPIAADVAAVAEEVAPDGARVLEVGCGPGHLSIRLARRHGLDTTGLDLDPAMIGRARANAEGAGEGFGRLPPGRLPSRSEEHTSELQSRQYLVCRLLLEKKNRTHSIHNQVTTMTKSRPRR